jgi:hypothetical protein
MPSRSMVPRPAPAPEPRPTMARSAPSSVGRPPPGLDLAAGSGARRMRAEDLDRADSRQATAGPTRVRIRR